MLKPSNGQATSTHFAYDGSGRLSDIYDPLGNHTNIAYVGTGNKVDHFTRASGTSDTATTSFSHLTQNCSGVSPGRMPRDGKREEPGLPAPLYGSTRRRDSR